MSALPNQTDPDNGNHENGPSSDGELEAYFRTLAEAMTDMAGQERQRMTIQREVAMRTLEVAENAEQLQYDLSVKQIEATDNQHRRRYGLARIVVIIIGALALVSLAVMVGVVAMAFFGDEAQSQTALAMLGYAFAAVGGAGILFLIWFSVNSLARWWQGM